MTPAEIALQLLPLIGVRSLDPTAPENDNANGQPGLSTGDVDACAIAITQAIQEIFALGPAALSEQRFSGILRPPQSVAFTATQYSTTISGFTTWASWMQGCTIQGGDGEDNELLSSNELLRPFLAGSGAVSATVYADAILLPDWIKNTIEPMESPCAHDLMAAGNRREFWGWGNHGSDTRPYHHNSGSYGVRHKVIGDPRIYFVESRYDPTSGALPLYLRFNPMPGRAVPITFNAKRKPPVIAAADISEDNDLVIPTDWHESILLPFAKKRFLSHPNFGNAPVAAQILEQYRLAKLNLESFVPQISPVRGHYR